MLFQNRIIFVPQFCSRPSEILFQNFVPDPQIFVPGFCSRPSEILFQIVWPKIWAKFRNEGQGRDEPPGQWRCSPALPCSLTLVPALIQGQVERPGPGIRAGTSVKEQGKAGEQRHCPGGSSQPWPSFLNLAQILGQTIWNKNSEGLEQNPGTKK